VIAGPESSHRSSCYVRITREERVNSHKDRIFEHYADKQQEFLSFVLDHCVTQGVGEPDQDKLPDLLALKYHSIGDAAAELGRVVDTRDVFISLQEHL